MPIFKYNKETQLESGATLPSYHLSYETWGELNAKRNNVVWIFHALTANANAADWWSGLVGEGEFFDPSTYFIVCVNMPGSCYGSISPLSINAETQQPYYATFPLITPRDMVCMYDTLRKQLQIEQIAIGIGGSMGGMQALEWAIEQPKLFKQLVLIATNAKHSPWGIAFNTAQRMAIEADQTWLQHSEFAGAKGLRAARAMAMVSYRNYYPFKETQSETDDEKVDNFRASTYQYYQGEKLVMRFNAYSYYALSKSMDAHNVGRARGGVAKALQQIQSQTLVIGIESDLLFPPEEQLFLSHHIPNTQFKLIDSPYGHDGFLIEAEELTQLLRQFTKPLKQLTQI
ncbi:MAG: homoserine O-acetyltransferase [Bacteroidia bacterium]|nr:homoserine O-acetyltransferase [Bacteroidia bacterium]